MENNTKTKTETTIMTPITGYCIETGETCWYTGRAGEGWVSTDPRDAFLGYDQAGAARRAAVLNQGTWAHRIHFTAEVN